MLGGMFFFTTENTEILCFAEIAESFKVQQILRALCVCSACSVVKNAKEAKSEKLIGSNSAEMH